MNVLVSDMDLHGIYMTLKAESLLKALLEEVNRVNEMGRRLLQGLHSKLQHACTHVS